MTSASCVPMDGGEASADWGEAKKRSHQRVLGPGALLDPASSMTTFLCMEA